MGVVFLSAEVASPEGKGQKLELLIDSGTKYSLLPEEIWKSIGLEEQKKRIFILADGTRMTFSVSRCKFKYQGVEQLSPVIMGGKGIPAVVGTVTLESMGLVLNPYTRELKKNRRTVLN